MPRAPLDKMTFRTEGLASAVGATYGEPNQIRRQPIPGGPLKGHQGWDLDAAVKTPCYAVEDGVIADTGAAPVWGNFVKLRFLVGAKTYYAFYAHLMSQVVLTGQSVRKGQIVGYTGLTGNAAGGVAHLHFEIHTQASAPGVPTPGFGTIGRADPGEILGFHIYSQLQSKSK